jgi:DNA excision repair protein ERCC-2
VSKAQAANRARLDAEYRRLVDNLVEAQQLRGGEEWLSNPTLPDDVVQESMPGTPQCLLDHFLFVVRVSCRLV